MTRPPAAETYELRPYPKIRRGYVDVLDAGRRKRVIHGLVEVDVTQARQLLSVRRELSFTAFVLRAVALSVEEDKLLHAYRRGRQLILFDEVDVNTQIEIPYGQQSIVGSLLVRAANRKSVEQITAEIRAGQGPEPGPQARRRYRGTLAFLSLPGPVRAVAWAAVMRNPRWFKRLGGTVGLSAVGMFGPVGGWGIPLAPPTLMVTVGGIVTKPRYIGGDLRPREMLDLTISVDHAVVDGAPAARFARRLAERLERADGL